MVSLEAMKLAGGAMLNGEVVGRVLRSRSAKAAVSQPNAKRLVDGKITFKVTKEAKGKPTGKREAGAGTVTESVVEEAVTKQGKRPRKTSNKSSGVSVSKTEVAIEVAPEVSGLGSGAQETLTTSSFKVESWSISLSTAEAIAEATKHLVAADAKLKQIIETQGAAPVWEHKGSAFSALARAIVYQQLAGRAADTIFKRLIALCGGPEKLIPAVIAGLSAEELRAVGISGRKATYLHGLAENFTSGALSDEKLAVMNEDDLVTALTAVKGIGVWSAHMFMIFYLHKPDVLPVGDLAIRKGFQKLFQLTQQPSAAEMQAFASSWRPYRTLASWYLWRMGDIKTPDS